MRKRIRTPKRIPSPQTMRIPDRAYRPNKAELGADMRIDATPESIAKAVVLSVNIRSSTRSKDRR